MTNGLQKYLITAKSGWIRLDYQHTEQAPGAVHSVAEGQGGAVAPFIDIVEANMALEPRSSPLGKRSRFLGRSNRPAGEWAHEAVSPNSRLPARVASKRWAPRTHRARSNTIKVDVAVAQRRPATSWRVASAKAACLLIDVTRPTALTVPLRSVSPRRYETFSSSVV